MAADSINNIKALFQEGDLIRQSSFENLLDSFLHKFDASKPPNEKTSALVDADGVFGFDSEASDVTKFFLLSAIKAYLFPAGGADGAIFGKASASDYDFEFKTSASISSLTLTAGDITNLQNNSNWSANNVYTGASITGDAFTYADNDYLYIAYNGTWHRGVKVAVSGNVFDPTAHSVSFNFDMATQTGWVTSGSPARGDTVIDVSGNTITFTKVGTGMLVNADNLEKSGSGNYYTFPTITDPGTGDFTAALVVSTNGSWGNDSIIECSNGHNIWVNWDGLGFNYNWGGASPGGSFTFGTLPTNDTKVGFIMVRESGSVTCHSKTSGGSWAQAGQTLTGHNGDFQPNHFKNNNDGSKAYQTGIWNEAITGTDLDNLKVYIDQWL